tara:strand:- start:815 stop:1726 length:912 start_codon:yes stop_codon:yes gene_type:complete
MKQKEKRNKIAVVILSFNRPQYLKQVIDSLKEQTVKDFDYWLFQDGGVNKYSWRMAGNQKDIEKCIELFTEAYPTGKVEHSQTNIGIGLNWKKAEEMMFLGEEYEQVIFLEDDLVLSPYYMETMVNLFNHFYNDSRIGMISAYGEVGGSRFPVVGKENSEVTPSHIRRMGHLWGIGVYRKEWLVRRSFMLEFYDIIGERDYFYRPWDEIANFYRKNGVQDTIALGQDGCKTASLLLFNQIKIAPSVNLARYIGEQGFHSDAANYDKHKYADMPIYDKSIKDFILSDRDYEDIRNALKEKYLEG